ncbi:GNAT family protein [Actinoplanes sp. NPDC048791]|uniref:GNAT family N-acetyltransferase n=1 Tax=Actinoplanes sp. NPDC048791 TaxID=3154623 RepID=UPI0033E54AC7
MTGDVRLRDTTPADVEIFHSHRRQPEAARRANIAAPDRNVYVDYWAEHVLGDNTVLVRTVVVDGEVAGNLLTWWRDDRRYLGGWFSQDFWGRGVGGRALRIFLASEPIRPLYADTDIVNTASQRLMERCGFERVRVQETSVEYVLRSVTVSGGRAGR